MIGRSVPRLEDFPLLTGASRYVADLDFPHQLHMRLVRSAHAHARILSIDTTLAGAAPGVVAVWTFADIADSKPIDFRDTAAEALNIYRQPILAKDHVRFVGEPVAAVFAVDAYQAEDAADLVVVELEELPPHLNPAGPVCPWIGGRSNEALVLRQEYGDLAAAFAAAHQIVSLDLAIGRHSGVPLETRGAIGRYDAARDILELHGAAKIPLRNREAMARWFGRAPHALHLHETHVGGGFGVRGELYPEDFLVCLAALRLGRPIKWIEDRREHLLAANQSRQQHHTVRAAIDASGVILGLEDSFIYDQGAYVRTHGARVADMTMGMLPGPYRIPAVKITGHIRMTHTTPTATYRAPGRYEGTFVRERLLDAVAARLGLDPIEVRRRNLITAAQMPFDRQLTTLDHPIIFDSGDYAALLDQALARIGWDRLQSDLARRRAAGEAVGAGLALFVEKGGMGPRDAARASVDVTGTVELVTGGAAVGQGFATAMAQICADTLGVDYRQVRVVHGHTDRIAYGVGAHASRATVMTGSATHETARKLRALAIEVAAELLQAPADTLHIANGVVSRRDQPAGASITLGEIARSLGPDSATLGDRAPGLAAEGWFRTDHLTYPYGVHIAVVRVDRETSQIIVERFLAAYDVGRAVNPMLIEGQLLGGVAQGIGGALLEEFLHDQAGQPLSTSLADYLLPDLPTMPPVDILLREDFPSPFNPLGLKGAGEGGITGVGAALAAAVDAALQHKSPMTRLPMTPQNLYAVRAM
jgi:CO/xanthine dehydrogenase Mo-binding subunit